MPLEKLMLMKKFTFAVMVLFVVTALWVYMKFDAANYRDIIIGLSGLFFGAQAFADIKKPLKPEGAVQ